jgi:hypothetical protein
MAARILMAVAVVVAVGLFVGFVVTVVMESR